jgi:predicted transcriptional regulator
VVGTTANDIVVSVRLDSDTVSQLDELAAEMQRSRSFLIAQAVQEFVEREYASLVAVREGEADIEAGRSLEGRRGPSVVRRSEEGADPRGGIMVKLDDGMWALRTGHPISADTVSDTIDALRHERLGTCR